MEEERQCQECGKVTTDYTYALSDDGYDGQQRKVLLVCISCRKEIGMFFKPKKG